MWLARQFANHGLNVNASNADGSTALTWSPNSEFSRFYISLGARVEFEARGSWDDLSLHLAAAAGRADQLELLLVDGGGLPFLERFNILKMSPLATAIYYGHYCASKCLLEAGADPNAINLDSTDMSNLQLALSKGYDRIAHLLLDFGARIETLGLHPSPLHSAQEHGLGLDLIKRLEEKT